MKRLLLILFAAALAVGFIGCTLDGELDGKLDGTLDGDLKTDVDIEWPEYFEIVEKADEVRVVSDYDSLLAALNSDEVVLIQVAEDTDLELTSSIAVNGQIIDLNGNTVNVPENMYFSVSGGAVLNGTVEGDGMFSVQSGGTAPRVVIHEDWSVLENVTVGTADIKIDDDFDVYGTVTFEGADVVQVAAGEIDLKGLGTLEIVGGTMVLDEALDIGASTTVDIIGVELEGDGFVGDGTLWLDADTEIEGAFPINTTTVYLATIDQLVAALEDGSAAEVTLRTDISVGEDENFTIDTDNVKVDLNTYELTIADGEGVEANAAGAEIFNGTINGEGTLVLTQDLVIAEDKELALCGELTVAGGDFTGAGTLVLGEDVEDITAARLQVENVKLQDAGHLAEALDGVSDVETVELTGDVTLDAGNVIVGNSEVTLNLGGFTLDADDNEELLIENELTVEDGELALDVAVDADTTFDGVTVVDDNTVTVGNATLTIGANDLALSGGDAILKLDDIGAKIDGDGNDITGDGKVVANATGAEIENVTLEGTIVLDVDEDLTFTDGGWTADVTIDVKAEKTLTFAGNVENHTAATLAVAGAFADVDNVANDIEIENLLQTIDIKEGEAENNLIFTFDLANFEIYDGAVIEVSADNGDMIAGDWSTSNVFTHVNDDISVGLAVDDVGDVGDAVTAITLEGVDVFDASALVDGDVVEFTVNVAGVTATVTSTVTE